MIPHRFEYHAPRSLEEAVELVGSADGGTAILGGGTWVVVELNQGTRRPERVVDLRHAGLGTVERRDGATVFGATATYSAVLAADVPAVVREMARGVTGGAQVRNLGSLGGSACYANPASDVPGLVVGLAATMRLAGTSGEREVAAADFFRGAFASDVREGELLTEIVVPDLPPGSRAGYVKFKLCESSWPIVTATCVVGADGAVQRLALGGAQEIPLLVEQAAGATDAASVEAAAGAAVTDPWSDVLAPGEYRRSIAGVIAKRAYLAAAA